MNKYESQEDGHPVLPEFIRQNIFISLTSEGLKKFRKLYFPVNNAFLFSKKAAAPSFISSVAKQFPNASISTA
jgi:hypothetical protein